jgi:AcrR family transcriptional regulator
MSVQPVESLRGNLKLLTRQRLIESAQACFEEKGYAQTSAEDITSRIGASRATFYLHFKGKSDVLAEIFANGHLRQVLDLVESLDALPDPLRLSDIQDWLDSYRKIYQQTRGVIRAFIQGESREGTALHAVSDTARETFLDVMSRKVMAIRERNGLPADPADARLRALLMFVELERFCYYVYLRNQKFSINAGLELIAEEWYRKLTGG